jgi:hypothetical protein
VLLACRLFYVVVEMDDGGIVCSTCNVVYLTVTLFGTTYTLKPSTLEMPRLSKYHSQSLYVAYAF